MSVGKNMSMMVTTFFQIRPTVLHPLAVYTCVRCPENTTWRVHVFLFFFFFSTFVKITFAAGWNLRTFSPENEY